MKRYQKLLAVIRHEYLTIVKQPAFWIALLIVPAFGAIGFGASYFSGLSEEPSQETVQDLNIAVVDNSDIIHTEATTLKNIHFVEHTSKGEKDDLITRVQNGKIDALIVYPEDITKTHAYQIYIDEDEDEKTDKEDMVSTLSNDLLETSILAPIDSEALVTLLQSGAHAEVTSYKNGEKTPGIAAYIVPGFFLVLFYIIFFFSVGYAMTSVAEEKENRAIEMVLSYIRPRTLMAGKLLAVALVAFTQLLFFITLGALAYVVLMIFGNAFTIPFELSGLVFAFWPILFGLLYCIFGFLLFVALMLATGAAFPSPKEASAFMMVFYLLAMSPYFFTAQIIDAPHGLFTTIMTYFPLTSAQTLLLRNTMGTLSVFESVLGLFVVVCSTMIAVFLAGRIFKISALNFTTHVSLRSIFGK